MDQRSGRPAEKHFSLLCSQSKITCNKSEEDDHGWDFIVEVPMPMPDALSADLVGEIRKCEVQVKASENGKPVVKLSLSNARAFAKSHLPCFIVCILDQNTSHPRVFIRHFWKHEIEQSLKRVREAGNKGKKLNDTFTQFTLSENEERSPEVIEWLAKSVRNLPHDYSSKKLHLEQTVGYEDGSWQGEVKFTSMESIEELVDHQLGLTKSIPVDLIRLVETRFDIEAPVPIFDGKPSLLRMRSQAKKECQIIFRSKDGAYTSIAATVTVPAIPNLPLEALKLRIDSWFLKAVVSNGKKVDFNFNLDFETPLTLEKLNQFFLLLSWGEEGPVEISIVADGRPMVGGNIIINHELGDISFADPSNIVAQLLDITRRAGTNVPLVTPSSLFNNWTECTRFYNYLTTDGAKLEVTVDRVIASDIKLQCLIGYIELNLETTAFVAVLEFPIEHQERNGNDMSFSLATPVIRDCYVGPDIEAIRVFGETCLAKFGAQTGKTTVEIGNLLNHPSGK